MTPIRLSPIHADWPPNVTWPNVTWPNVTWQEINGMPSVVAVSDEQARSHLGLADVSCLTRFGVKGAGAAAWLASQGVTVSSQPNTWISLPDGGIVARLGLSEFLIEDSLDSQIALRLAASESFPAQVYPVLRQDLAIALCGVAVNELLLQTCSFNFRALNWADNPVVLTSIAGVAVTVIPGAAYRIWCDRTFGSYLWRTLREIAEAEGGGAIGTGWLLSQFSQLLFSHVDEEKIG